MTDPPPVVEGRTIRGASAVLLPMADGTTPDWDALAAHVGRTIEAGLVPAVNMDTGFGPYLDDASREMEIGNNTGNYNLARDYAIQAQQLATQARQTSLLMTRQKE